MSGLEVWVIRQARHLAERRSVGRHNLTEPLTELVPYFAVHSYLIRQGKQITFAYRQDWLRAGGCDATGRNWSR